MAKTVEANAPRKARSQMGEVWHQFRRNKGAMVGSAIVRQLELRADIELVLRDRTQLDLLDSNAVQAFFRDNQIDQVYLAAAKVGGIVANNTYPAEFIYQNLMIEANIIHAAHLSGVQKLLFLGSSCIYPKMAKQPITESELLQGTLEATNEPYAIAKIAGIKAADEGLEVKGSVMASDAFFPFRDGIDAAAEAGITCVIQPGGSMRDQEVIDAADEHGMAMVFTNMRHFRH